MLNCSGAFTNNQLFDNLDSGSYSITVKDNKGCVVKDTFNVNNIGGPTSITSKITATSCFKNDGIIALEQVHGGSAPYLFELNSGAYSSTAVFKDLPSAMVTFSAIDSAGCVILDSTFIPSSSPPDSALLIFLPDHCVSSVGSIAINQVFGGNAPFTFSLDNTTYTPTTGFKALKSDDYTLYTRDAKNCLLKTNFKISNISGPEKIYVKIKDAVCGSATGNIRIDSVSNGSSPYLFSLDGQSFNNTNTFKNVLPGVYSLTAKDQFGCVTSIPLNINYVMQYGINILPHDTVVCFGQDVIFRVNFENETAVKSIRWVTGEKNNFVKISPLQNSFISVAVTDNNGCIKFDTAYMKVKACNTGSKCVAIPATFTPNGDGLNDNFGPIVNGCSVQNLLFRVYNRYGKLIFETKDMGKKWNGKINNTEQPQGGYIFTCHFTTDDNIARTMQGSFILLR